MGTVVIGLGNDLVADDAIGLLAARALRPELAGAAQVIESSEHGLALLELFLDHDRAVVIDAVCTGRRSPGEVFEVPVDQLRPVAAPSPHYAGLPEMVALAAELGLPFPREVRVFAVEVADLTTLGGPMTPAVASALPELCRLVIEAVAAPAPRPGSGDPDAGDRG